MIGSILLGFLTALLYCAIIILVAFLFVWALKFLNVAVDGDVLKWGKAVVALLCIIVMATWLLGALGLAGSSRYFRLGDAGPAAASRTVSAQHLQGVLT